MNNCGLWLTSYALNIIPRGEYIHERMAQVLLLPPGIRNDGNICFTSCILHWLFNQSLFRKVLPDVGMSHERTCGVCNKGYIVITQNIMHLMYS